MRHTAISLYSLQVLQGPGQLCVSCHARRLRNSSAHRAAAGGIRMTWDWKSGSWAMSGFQYVVKPAGHKAQDKSEVCFFYRASPSTKLFCSQQSLSEQRSTDKAIGRNVLVESSKFALNLSQHFRKMAKSVTRQPVIGIQYASQGYDTLCTTHTKKTNADYVSSLKC